MATEIKVGRYEAKYIVPRELVAEIRAFIRPFCERDPYGIGELPEYRITTLQLDTPTLSFHRAKDSELDKRFKLRVRGYGDVPNGSVFVEIKQKVGGAVEKRRAAIQHGSWSRDLFRSARLPIRFRSLSEESHFLTFSRLVQSTGAVPLVRVRYIRESYIGRFDHYARVTFDRRLEYQRAKDWTVWGDSGRWRPMDSALTQQQGLPYSGVVLELKALWDVPMWMIEVVQRFDLVRMGNCKYSTAVWQEALFDPGLGDAPHANASMGG